MIIEVPPILIELRPSLLDKGGVGVFAADDLIKGRIVAEGVGMDDFDHQITWADAEGFDKKIIAKIMAFCVGTSVGFIPPPDMDFNDLSIGWYINHSCEGNLGFDGKGNFIAIDSIRKGEELSYDYGLIESNPKFEMRCECGSKVCRKRIGGNNWKLLAKDKIKAKYMHPFLSSVSMDEKGDSRYNAD